MKVQYFSTTDLDILRSHNDLQCEIFDNKGEGGLKLHPKHIKMIDSWKWPHCKLAKPT
jgi:hypothetical protein